ncbi:hypothetical protein COCNU_07G014320 [Cocos nucifera]|uniref:Uncharacterized protein n=1 Tax=Cocos nucifera TaxID=13894 RepID=A0A8K0IG88_COCNU|nr:hypothetical protein COCNU_07G014320 [Cocos nucifera]
MKPNELRSFQQVNQKRKNAAMALKHPSEHIHHLEYFIKALKTSRLDADEAKRRAQVAEEKVAEVLQAKQKAQNTLVDVSQDLNMLSAKVKVAKEKAT